MPDPLTSNGPERVGGVTPPPIGRPIRDGRFLLYVDDSKHWHQAARLVAQYLRQTGGHVTVLSVALLTSTRERALADARRILGLEDARIKLVGRTGLVERELPQVASEEQADLVIVGRLGSVDRLTNGLIAHLIVKRTPASVLIVRGRPESLRSILVCTEGERHGARDFDTAAIVARAFGAKLTVLHVLSQMSLNLGAREPAERHAKEFLASDDPVARHLRELDDRMHALGLDGSIRLRSGLVVDEIVDELRAGKHDLLVIGGHAPHAREAVLYEDVAAHILRASPVSTLIVRH